ncbi:MAG: flavin reductase family protein [Planctomycetales bacterium]|nr:flavin reductase family protein [Planctomycetales bacterium]
MSAEEVFQLLDREVWAVTAGDDQQHGASLATWVMQASLLTDCPVVVAGLAPNHHTAEVLDRSGAMAVHLLRLDQTELALQFAARSGHERDKLSSVPTRHVKATPVPILADCAAWLAGRVFARLNAGDRVYYWMEVLESERLDDGPLLRQSQVIAAADPETRDRLREDRMRDMQLHAPWAKAWRRSVALDETFRLTPHPED